MEKACRKGQENKWRKGLAGIVTFVMLTGALSGCAGKRYIAGDVNQEFVHVKDSSVTMECALLILAENKYAYENMFDQNIWKETVDGVSMETYTKDVTKDAVEHILILNQMAEDMDVTTTEEEEHLLLSAAKAYMATYPANAKPTFYDENTVRDYYADLLTAKKVFYALTDSVNTEVSTDEARIIDVQYIFVAGSRIEEDGTITKLSAQGRKEKEQLARNLLTQIQDGTDLISLVEGYSEDKQYYLELGRGEYDKAFEDAAFALEMGELSDVVETEAGFYIIKCINDNVSEDYERRKEAIVLERRRELFESSYEEYLVDFKAFYNENFWKGYPLDQLPRGTGKLEEIFEKYLSEN